MRPDEEGHFALRDLAEGPGHLVVWHERGEEPMRQPITLPSETPIDVSLKMTRARVPTHLNKTGGDYPRPSDDY